MIDSPPVYTSFMRVVAFLFIAAGLLAAQSGELTSREKEFQDSMTGVVLEGQSTRDGRAGVSDDKYIIDKVVKQSGDTWTFHVRVPIKGQPTAIPFPIRIQWAGDTPVITMTDQALPGMGTYTARVLIYRGQYAGTWSGKTGGGKVFGGVVKQ
jgi:hypothetical protein